MQLASPPFCNPTDAQLKRADAQLETLELLDVPSAKRRKHPHLTPMPHSLFAQRGVATPHANNKTRKYLAIEGPAFQMVPVRTIWVPIVASLHRTELRCAES